LGLLMPVPACMKQGCRGQGSRPGTMHHIIYSRPSSCHLRRLSHLFLSLETISRHSDIPANLPISSTRRDEGLKPSEGQSLLAAWHRQNLVLASVLSKACLRQPLTGCQMWCSGREFVHFGAQIGRCQRWTPPEEGHGGVDQRSKDQTATIPTRWFSSSFKFNLNLNLNLNLIFPKLH
jgi:hypothetical protein